MRRNTKKNPTPKSTPKGPYESNAALSRPGASPEVSPQKGFLGVPTFG